MSETSESESPDLEHLNIEVKQVRYTHLSEPHWAVYVNGQRAASVVKIAHWFSMDDGEWLEVHAVPTTRTSLSILPVEGPPHTHMATVQWEGRAVKATQASVEEKDGYSVLVMMLALEASVWQPGPPFATFAVEREAAGEPARMLVGAP